MSRKDNTLQVFRFPYDMSSHTGKIVYSQSDNKILEKSLSSLTFTADGLTGSFVMSGSEIMLFSEELIVIQAFISEGLKENVSRKITLDPSYVLDQGYTAEMPIYINFYPEVSVTNVLLGNEAAVIPCDRDGLVADNMTITIPFAGYIGASRAACVAADPTLPSGMTLVSNNPATSSADGSIVVSVAKDSNLGGANDGTIALALTCNGLTFSKTFSWAKTKSGEGVPGEPATTIVCSNEAITIPCKMDGTVADALTVNISFAGFIGITKSACSVSVTGLPSGMTVTSNTPGTAASDGLLVLAIAANSTLGSATTLSGDVTLTFTCNSLTFVKAFSWSKAMAGTNGAGIIKSTPYYKSQLESDPAPAKPTTIPPTGWSLTEPGYESGKVTYTCWLIQYSDNTHEYSDVSMMASYTAAAEAWAKAETAEKASKIKYGTCTTLANVAAKVVNAEGFELFDGAEITVGFAFPNTTDSPTINVNATGAKPVYVSGAAVSSTNKLLWEEYSEISFMYNGTAWVMIGAPMAYYAECSTAAATANKAIVVPKCVVCKGTILNVYMSFSNEAASPAIELSGSGAIPMRAAGAAIPATSIYNWVSTSTVSFTFDGQYWQMNNTSDIADRNYFWHDSDGAHVSTQPGDATVGPNVLVDSDSLDIRNGTTVRASFGENTRIGETGKSHLEMDYHSLQLKDKEGNTYFYASDLRDETGVAEVQETFTGDGSTREFTVSLPIDSVVSVTVNGTSASYTIQTSKRIRISNAPGVGTKIVITYNTTSTQAKAYTAGYRNSNSTIGPMSFAEGYDVTANGLGSHAEGNATQALASYSHAEGGNTVANDRYAHAEGYDTEANDQYSHAEGFGTEANKSAAHVEGYNSVANGTASHAEGWHTEAGGNYSHAEGYNSQVSGNTTDSSGIWAAHAEGYYTTAANKYAHAEGFHTSASGEASHASGTYTTATRDNQTVIGKYNALVGSGYSTDAAFVIGGGTSDDVNDRKDIFGVNWDGKIIKSPDAWHNFIQIPANADLNDYYTFGKYVVANNNDAATLTNSPSTTAGILLVIPQGWGAYNEQLIGKGYTWAYTQQIYFNMSGGGIFSRYGSTGSGSTTITWNSWTSMGTTNSITNAGIVPAPTSSKPYHVYVTDDSGNPGWSDQIHTAARTLIVGAADTFNKNFLYISTTNKYAHVNKRAYFIYDDSTKSQFGNIPTQLNLETGYVSGFREVYWINSSDILVKVTEVWPKRGRIHYNRYNGSTWNGWRCTAPDFLETNQFTGFNYSDTTRIIVTPVFSYANLGLESSVSDSDFYKAWLKKICEIYPNRSGYTFVANATPNSRRMVMCYIYNTSTINSTTGLPEAAFGVSFSYSAYNYLCGRFGTQSYNYYYSSYYKPESTVVTSETVGTDQSTIASSGITTWTKKGSKTFGAGTYWMEFTAEFEANSNGIRCAAISTTNSAQTDSQTARMNPLAGNAGYTYVKVSGVRKFTADTTVNFLINQNSGSTLKTYGRLQYIRLTNV